MMRGVCAEIVDIEGDKASAVLTETPTDKYFHCLFIALQIHQRISEIQFLIVN